MPLASRALAVAAVAVAVAYLAWRTTTIGGPGRWWLSIPLVVIEAWGFVGFAVFAAATWGRPGADPPPAADSGSFPRAEIFIDARGSTADAIERTLVGVAALRGAGAVTMLVNPGDAPANLAVALPQATRIVTDRPAVAMVATADSPLAVWLDAGQITMPDALESTVARFDDDDVATCQVAVGLLSANSLAPLHGARDQAALMRRVVGPSLSARGVAPWTGPGSIIRTSALADVLGPDPTAITTGQVRGRLLRHGWRTSYEARELVRDVSPDTLAGYLVDRHDRTSSAWRAARRPGGAFRRGGGGTSARLAPLHDVLAASAGVRHLCLAIVTCAVVVSGQLPFSGSAASVGAPWLAVTGLVALTRRATAADTMSVGDWTRQAWRTLPADAAALFGRRLRGPTTGRTQGRFAALGILWPLALTILAIDLAIVARAYTLLVPDALPRFETTDRVLVLIWALALLVPLVDVLLGAARRRQRRTAPRLETSLPMTLGDTATRTIDISPSGVGLLVDAAPAVGSVTSFDLTLPVAGGAAERISGTATVRSATIDPSGRVRVGLEFLNLAPEARAALIGYCGVGHAIEFVDRVPSRIEPAHLEVEQTTGRTPVGGFTGLAVAVGIAVVLAGPSAGVALADEARPVEQVCVATTAGSPIAGAVVSRSDSSGDQILGATTNGGCVAVAAEDDDVSYRAAVGGTTATGDTAQANGGVLTITLLGRSVTVVDTAGRPVPVQIRTFTGSWSEPADIGGTTALAPDAAIEAVEVRWNGTTNVLSTAEDIVVVLARLVQDPNASVVEVDRGAGWEPFTDGMEMLPGRLAARLDDGTVVKLDVPGDHEMAIPSGTIERLDIAVDLATAPIQTADPAPTEVAATPTPTAPTAAPEPEPDATATPPPTSEPDPEPTPAEVEARPGAEEPAPTGAPAAEAES